MKIKALVLITLLVCLLVLVYMACNKSTPTQPQSTPVPAQTEVAKPAEPNAPEATTPTIPPIKPPSVSIAADDVTPLAPIGPTGGMSGAIFTTDATCTGVNVNIYSSKDDVYIDGGPAHPGAAGLPDGKYYVQVTDPDGTPLGTSIGSGDETPVEVLNGEFKECYQLSAILIKASNGTQGYDNTTNPGGEYKVWVSQVSDFDPDKSKTDNFKVGISCTPCTLTCPGNVTVECDESIDPSNTGYPTTTCLTTPTYTDVVTAGACAQAKTITRTWSVDDGCEGTATCTQIITVVDTKAPVLSGCPDPDGGSYECLSEVPAPVTVTATDNCDTDVPVVYKETQSNQGSNCHNTITRTWTATDDCGNSASCKQTIYVDDTTPPTVQCPASMTVNLLPGDDCPPVVTFTATGEDNCNGKVTVSCDPSSGSTFKIGTTTVTCTATDACGNVSEPCSFTVTVNTAVCALKFYDANANGINDDGQVVAGWKFNLSGNGSQYTSGNGKTCFIGLAPGSYTVTEVAPNTKWVATTPTSQTVNLGCPTTVEFGNVCLGAGGANSKGYWGNKNGQALITGSDLCALNDLCLKNGSGADFNPVSGCPNPTSAQVSTGKTNLKNWLQDANAVNMAFMLSAQLAAMKLNVLHGFVSGNALVYAPGCGGFITINDLMDAANNALCGGASRSYQECLKNALDNANNNKNFVQPKPCPVVY